MPHDDTPPPGPGADQLVQQDAQLAARAASLAREALAEGADLRRRLADDEEQRRRIAAAAALLVRALRGGGRVFFCGNGGSAADCQHFAAELTGRFSKAPRRGLAAIALTTDTSALTAIANDFSFAEVFARQLEGLGRPGDALVAITTSGRSPNVLRAAEVARAQGLGVVGLTGPDGGALAGLADVCICVPGAATQRVQELHLTVGHILCEIIDEAFIAAP